MLHPIQPTITLYYVQLTCTQAIEGCKHPLERNKQYDHHQYYILVHAEAFFHFRAALELLKCAAAAQPNKALLCQDLTDLLPNAICADLETSTFIFEQYVHHFYDGNTLQLGPNEILRNGSVQW